jgi:hypothetical protein
VHFYDSACLAQLAWFQAWGGKGLTCFDGFNLAAKKRKPLLTTVSFSDRFSETLFTLVKLQSRARRIIESVFQA